MNEPRLPVYEFHNYRLNTSKRLVYDETGETLPLSPKVFDTLVYLVENRGKVVEKDELMKAIWNDTIVEENNLNKNISILRRALGEKPGEHRFIVTVPGHGYRFIPEVRIIENDESKEAAESAVRPPEKASEIPPVQIRPQKRKNYIAPALAGIFAVALAAAFFFLWRNSSDKVSEPEIKTVAVLPFMPLVAENRNEALELGMADALISKLGESREITVRPFDSVRRYAVLEQDALAAGRELGTDAVLAGTIQNAGERIRISTRLFRVSDGRQLWAGQFDEKLTDIFAVQDSITEKAAAALKTRLEKRPKSFTENVEAYQLYLKGRFHFLKVTRQGSEKAVSYFKQAIELDPNYALAYAGLADAYRALAINGEMSPSEFMPKAKSASQKAIELDDTLSDAHAVLGFIVFWFDWDWEESERQYKRALQLNPNNADALIYYANLHSNLGRHGEALAMAKHARELDPLNLRTNALEAQFLLHAGQIDQALERLQKTLELDPNFWFANIFSASAYIEKGMYAEAIEHARRAGGVYESSRVNAFLGYALAKSGREREARAELERTLKLAKETYVSPYNVAMIYNGLGMREETLRWLERGYEQREPRMTILKVEPKWNNLRGDPRFIELMRRMNLE